MKFKEGQPKIGGRKAGTPNKKTERLMDLLGTYGVEPVKEIVNLLPALTPKEQVDVYRDLLNYVYPKRKAVEVSGDDPDESGTRVPLTLEERKALVRIARSCEEVDPRVDRIIERTFEIEKGKA